MRTLNKLLFHILPLGVAAYAAVAYALFPLGALVHPGMRASFEAHQALVYTHVFASVFALALGPWQFSPRLRRTRPGLHRWIGRLYLGVGVLVGGLAGLLMSQHAFGGIVARLGFGTLAVCWLATGALAFHAIRRGDVAAHRRWMVRNFSLTLAAVSLRLMLPLAMAAGVPMEVAYPFVAWLCWVPNLLAAERMLLPSAARAAAA